MGGKTSQKKGRRAEIELARILQGYGYSAEPGRALNYGAVPDLIGLPDIHIECKRAEALRLSEWLAQARRDADKFGDGMPAVFHRKNKAPWLVTMELPSWLEIYRSYQPPKQSNHNVE